MHRLLAAPDDFEAVLLHQRHPFLLAKGLHANVYLFRHRGLDLLTHRAGNFVRHKAKLVDCVTAAGSEKAACFAHNAVLLSIGLHRKHRFPEDSGGTVVRQPRALGAAHDDFGYGTRKPPAKLLRCGCFTFDRPVFRRSLAQNHSGRHAQARRKLDDTIVGGDG